MQIISGPYPNREYGFASPVGLWKVVVRVPVFVIAYVAINTFIGLKAVPQVIQVCSCVYKCCLKGHQGAPRGTKTHWVNSLSMVCVIS